MKKYSSAQFSILKNQWVIFGAAVIGACVLIYFVMTLSEKKEKAPSAKAAPATHITVAPNDADMGRQQALYNDRLMKLEKENREARTRELKLEGDKRRLEERLVQVEKSLKAVSLASSHKPREAESDNDGWPPAEVLGKSASNTSPRRTGFRSGAAYDQTRPLKGQSAQGSERVPVLVVQDFGKGALSARGLVKDDRAREESEKDAKRLTYIPSGTFAKVRLLNGATAPTRGQGSGNPVPMLMEITDKAIMPNLYRSGIKRCFVTGHGTGELASERVLVRLDRLSCIDENGGAVDKKIQGYVSGEDGKTGLRAKLVTKSGQAIANALFTGTLAGLGKAVSLSAENQTTSITGTVSSTVTNPWRAGFGEGTSHAMDRITDYYLKLASDLFPVLEVDSGREVDIVISNGFSMDRID